MPAARTVTPASRLPARAFRLRNGLTVVVQTDRTVPLVAVSLTYKVGSLDEEKGRAGFAHLFEHLMFQGTKNLPPNAVSKLVEESGGVDNAYTMKTNTTYHETIPAWALESVLWCEADRMRGLVISPRELEVEKRVVLEEMRQSYHNQPYRRATDSEMGALAFARWESAHPTIGVEEDLRAAGLDDVRAFYDRHYAPNNAVLALAGDVTPAEARRLAQKHFGLIPRRPIPKRADLSEPRPAEPRRRRVEDPLAKTPLLVLGWHAPARAAKDYWALAALGSVLSSGEDSPLHEALVKKARLAVSAGAHMPYWNSHVTPRGPDLFGVFVSPRQDADLDAVAAETEKVLERMRRVGPTEEELDRARTQAERAWIEGQQSLSERAQTLSSYAAFVGAPAGFWKDLGKVLRVTRADARRAARRWLDPRRRLTLEVVPGPAAAPAEPVEETEPPEEAPRGPGTPPPPLGRSRPVPLPALERFELPGGLAVTLVVDRRLPLAEARLTLRAGRAHEGPGEESLSQAAEELLFKGCAGQDAAAVARSFSRLGWSAGAASESEWFKVSAAGLARSFEPFCAQLGRVLETAAFPEEESALWRENAVEELASRRAQPSFLSEERLRAELFPGHPYGRGHADEARIAAVDSARLRRFHAARLRPGGGHLTLVGDLDPRAARRALEAAFAGWSRGATYAPDEAPPLPDHGWRRTALVDRPGSAQASLVVAQPMDATPRDPAYLSLVVANHVLGGTANARLCENLRTRRGYTYGAYSSFDAYRRGVVWSASTETRPEVAKAAHEELILEAERLRDEPIDAAALGMAKRHLAGLFLMRIASPDRLAAYLAAVVESGRDPKETMGNYQARLDAVTPDSARAAVRRWLDPTRFVTVVVGDGSVLRPALGL
ncbi:MAG: pitrilysin family protein [Elusimicrobiota bacterium]|nr:pitrilysin family protein [Elusimicrobiota bacterium]